MASDDVWHWRRVWAQMEMMERVTHPVQPEQDGEQLLMDLKPLKT